MSSPNPIPAVRNRRWVSVALKLSVTTALLILAATMLALLMADSGRPVSEWAKVYGLALISIGLLFTLYLDRVLTMPVRLLAAHATRMARGDYSTGIKHDVLDEIGELYAAIDFLRVSFLKQKEALEELNRSLDQKVDARTGELSRALVELKAAQEALIRTERLASIGGLAGGVAHEINNPTGVILTRAQFLLRISEEEKFSADVIEDLQAIQRQAERIARITASLLSFSRQQPAAKAPFVLKEMVAEALDLVEANLRGGNVVLEKNIAADLPRLLGDKGKLEQVLVNLMKNAIDAMPAGGTLTVAVVRAGEKHIAINVRDTGTGIPPEVQAKIFEPFFTTKEVGKGTGLGLSIAYGIVSEHGGELTVSSKPGEGTEFHLVLPIVEESAVVVAREA